MGHIDTNKPAKNPTSFMLKDLSGAGSPFLRAVQEVSKEESTRQNALAVMRPQRVSPTAGVRAGRVTDPGDRGGTSDRLGEFKLPEVLSIRDWGRRVHPELIGKRKIPRRVADNLRREYQQYIATQRAVGELALGGAQENRLRFVANQRAAKGPDQPKFPGNIGGQLGFAILTGVEETKVARLRELFEISQGLRDGGGKARRGRGRGVEAPPALEKRAFEAIANEEYEHPSIRLMLNFHGLRQQEKKEPSVLDRLKDMVVAERIKLGREGPVAQVFRDVSATLRPPQPLGQFEQELALGVPGSTKKFPGFLAAITSPATWLEEERKSAGAALRFMGNEATQARIVAAFRDKAIEFLPAAEVEHRRGKMTIEDLNRMRLYAGLPPLAPPENETRPQRRFPPFPGK